MGNQLFFFIYLSFFTFTFCFLVCVHVTVLGLLLGLFACQPVSLDYYCIQPPITNNDSKPFLHCVTIALTTAWAVVLSYIRIGHPQR